MDIRWEQKGWRCKVESNNTCRRLNLKCCRVCLRVRAVTSACLGGYNPIKRSHHLEQMDTLRG